jgi:hypothetical protein
MHLWLWREHDPMRQCKNIFEEISWNIRGKETGKEPIRNRRAALQAEP